MKSLAKLVVINVVVIKLVVINVVVIHFHGSHLQLKLLVNSFGALI